MTDQTTFRAALGHQLAGALTRPAGRTRAVALFAHCFTCTKQSLAAVRVSEELARLGIATLRFDFTGLGSSGGDFARAGFGSDVDDLVAAAGHLADTVGAPGLLVGHSLGGAAVLAAAARIPSARAVATIGAPADVAHVLGTLKGDLPAIERDGRGEVTISGRPFPISAAFLASARAVRLVDVVHDLRVPLLFAHAPLDEVVDVDNARVLFEAARHPKSFVSLDDADHLLTRARDAGYVARLIADWADRYLPDAVEGDAPAEGTVEAVNDGPAFLTPLRRGSPRLGVGRAGGGGRRGRGSDALRPAAGRAGLLHRHDVAHGGPAGGHSAGPRGGASHPRAQPSSRRGGGRTDAGDPPPADDHRDAFARPARTAGGGGGPLPRSPHAQGRAAHPRHARRGTRRR